MFGYIVDASMYFLSTVRVIRTLEHEVNTISLHFELVSKISAFEKLGYSTLEIFLEQLPS